jgi:hypothetical protein
MFTGGRNTALSNKKKIILLIGSPKPANSTSESLGKYLIAQLPEVYDSKTFYLWKAIRSNKEVMNLLDEVGSAELLVWSLPLYVDSLPYPVIKMMELMIDNGKKTGYQGKKMLAVINSGFPEAHQSNYALEMCREFANMAGFEWIGGLARGGGMSVNGIPLEDCPRRMVGNIKEALKLTASAITKGNRVPDKAISLMAEPPMPQVVQRIPVITWFGNWMWKNMAKKGVNLRDQPYMIE